MLCPFKFPLGCVGHAPTCQCKNPPIPLKRNMAAQQNTSKSMDRKVNSLLSGSNQRLTGSPNHRKWELKGNTRLYLVHSFASGKINYTYITPDRCLSNSITSPSNPFQCFCMSAVLMASLSYRLIWTSTAALSDRGIHPSHRKGEEITLFFLAFYIFENWNVKETSLIKDED